MRPKSKEFSLEEWRSRGRNPVKEVTGWRRFFCSHTEKDGAPEKIHILYSDIRYLQCEKCGAWVYQAGPSRAGEILKHMLRGGP